MKWNSNVELRNLCTLEGTNIPSKGVFVANKWVATVSEDYLLVPNADLVDCAVEAALQSNLQLSDGEVHFTGRQMHIQWLTNLELKNPDGKEIHATLHLFNSYDGTKSVGIAINGIRIFCMNMLYLICRDALKIIHTEENRGTVDNATFVEAINLLKGDAKEKSKKWLDWNEVELNDYKMDYIGKYIINHGINSGYVDQVFSRVKRLLSEKSLTLWRLYNAFSYCMTSPIGVRNNHVIKGKNNKPVILNQSSKLENMKNISQLLEKAAHAMS